MSLVVREVTGLVSVQDRGRAGWLDAGMPSAGAMDARAAALANALVGNEASMALLECGLASMELTTSDDTVVACTGAPSRVHVDGVEESFCARIHLRAGQTLRVSPPARGMWSYLAVRGGIDSDVVMGSRSCYPPAHLDGLCGRAIRATDVLGVGPSSPMPNDLPHRRLAEDLFYGFDLDVIEVRAIPTAHEGLLTQAGVAQLWEGTWSVTAASGRMGYRLDGEPIELSGTGDVISEPVVAGCVQVPGSGLPMVLTADHQTCGGYVRPAVVASCDLPLLVQRRAGQKIRLLRCDVDETTRCLRDDARYIDGLRPVPRGKDTP